MNWENWGRPSITWPRAWRAQKLNAITWRRMLAHELRTPRSPFKARWKACRMGSCRWMRSRSPRSIRKPCCLTALVGDLKLLSLAEAGQLKLELREIDPGELSVQINEQIKPQADQKGVHLEVEVQLGLSKISGDPDRIFQIVNNLISNALRFTPKDGFIRVQVSSSPNDRNIQVSISDTGSGIDV